MAKKKADMKIVRGYSLSKENVLWLTRRAFAETLKRSKGTVSASQVMDAILTKERKKDEFADVVANELAKRKQ